MMGAYVEETTNTTGGFSYPAIKSEPTYNGYFNNKYLFLFLSSADYTSSVRRELYAFNYGTDATHLYISTSEAISITGFSTTLSSQVGYVY